MTMATRSVVSDDDNEYHIGVHAAAHRSIEIIDEWRLEISSLTSVSNAATLCKTCGCKGNAEGQLQALQIIADKQLRRLQKLQETVVAMKQDVSELREVSKSEVESLYTRSDFVERAVLSDTNLKDAIVLGRVSDLASRGILDAAICTFFPDLPTAQKDAAKKQQLDLLQRHLDPEGIVDTKGLLDDAYFLIEVEAQYAKDPVLSWPRGASYKEKAQRLRQRIFLHLDSFKHEVESQRKLIEVNTTLSSDSKSRMDAKKAELERLRSLQQSERQTAASSNQERSQPVLGKRSRSLSVSNSSDLPSVAWSQMSNIEKISRLNKEIQLLEDSIRIANDNLTKAHDQLTRLEPIVRVLQKGSQVMRDETLLIGFIVDKTSESYPDTHLEEYGECLVNIAKRNDNGILFDALYGPS
ncbi:hypothetical protein ACEPAF_3997 [Sanghuangporus sanghuang]